LNALQIEAIRAHALPGAIIGTRPGRTKNLFRKLVSWQIRSYQKRLFPHAPRISPAAVELTHVLQYISPDEVWEFTAPRARRIRLEEIEGEIYGFANVRPELVPTFVSMAPGTPADLISESWRELEGQSYDYLDLLDFLLYEKLRYPKALTPVFSGILGLGRKRFVCSTVIAYNFRLCHERLPGYPRLLASVPVELTTPAHFFLSPRYFDLSLLYNLGSR